MITVASLGENLLRQYPRKKSKKLRDRATDMGTLGKVSRAWRDPKAKTR